MPLADRLFGQAVTCAECGLGFRERQRHPCPRCKATARIISRQTFESMKPVDSAGGRT